ncbi:restriction endonuclease subunit S [Marinobacter sp. ELB17]|uniref:restriction endonuclease subunit S n=1 Tax=Marinobacter sp. ELB17 TaxID=270374 RepID=UPI0000F39ABA|nr:restriction endonuclease subunit S [Marinobacter sp. ELB17]EAZ98519.1 specificity determinant for hsdM and hsdR [Marinobacter sp. ELB17]
MASHRSEWAQVIAATGFTQISTTGKKVKTKDCLQTGRFPVIDQGQNPVAGYVDDPDRLINVSDPLIVFGDHTRAVKWVDFSFVPGADGTKILQPEPYLFPRFAYYQLRSLEIPNKGYSRHFKFLKELKFEVAPLAEQKTIAVKLDTLLAQVENTKARLERIPTILKRFRQSVLAAAVSGRLTEEWRNNRTTKSSPKKLLNHFEELRQIAVQDENLRTGKKTKYKPVTIDTYGTPGDLPNSWYWIPVEALATKVTDGVHKKPTYISNGVPFITVKNLTKGNGISFTETNYISTHDHEEFCKRTNPEKGDILISKDGTLGVVRQIRTDAIFSIFVSVALVKPADRSMSNYLELAFQSSVVQGQMIGVGTGLQHIHLIDLRKDLIPVPPLEEQIEIVHQVDQLFAYAERVEQQVNNALARVNKLTQSILAKAFRGELTEQWRKDNPNLISGENSAAALLERIKVERAAMKPTNAARKRKTSA